MNAFDDKRRCVPPSALPHPYPTFSLLNKPPSTPPPTAKQPELWSIQLHWWNKHTPHDGEQNCKFCGFAWPCPSWFHWDDLLKLSIGIDPRRQPGSDL